MKQLSIIGVPSSAGARRSGQELAPQSFRRAGFFDQLQSTGLELIDLGDLPEVPYRPDHAHTKAQNLNLVIEVVEQVAGAVRRAVSDHTIPIVLGGDCTITIGVLSGMIGLLPNLGLLYFDGDLDLNTPDTTPSGIFDGMVMAHILGKAEDKLTHIGPRYPLMLEKDTLMFGYNLEAGWIDEAELEVLQSSQLNKFPASQIRGRVKDSAREALGQLEHKVDSILVHFDVDVIDMDDFPAADVPHDQGLSFEEAMGALETFISSRKFGGLVITEFNAKDDPGVKLALQLVNNLVKILEKSLI